MKSNVESDVTRLCVFFFCSLYPLHPCLLSGGSVHATPKAADNVQGADLFCSAKLHLYSI